MPELVQFLIDYAFFNDDYTYDRKNLYVRSFITGQRFRITSLVPFGYSVSVETACSPQERHWKHLLSVADCPSVIGVVSDEEFEWMKRDNREKKRQWKELIA